MGFAVHKSRAGRRSPRILFVGDPAYAPIDCRIRGTQLRGPFEERGWNVEFAAICCAASDSTQRQVEIALGAKDVDAVCFNGTKSLALVRRIRRVCSGLLIFNLSDPLWTPYFRERGGWADIDKILSAVDAIVCTTSYAREYALKFGKLTIVVPEYANLDLFDSMRGTVGKVLGKIRLGWVGGETTTRAICKIEAVLEQLARAYPAVELRLVGVGPNGMLPTFRYLRYTTRPAGYSEEEMARELLGMDVGLFPPPLDLYNYEVRGPLKALNYMAAAVPCVCQNAGVLREIIVDGVNGMLAGGLDEWKEKIEALLRDASLRRRMGEAGLATVRAHFAPEDIRSLFVNEVEQACEVIDLPHPVTRIPYRLTTRLDWARLALGGWTLSMLRRIRILTRIRSWLRRHPTAG